jgi:hypothetical protein
MAAASEVHALKPESGSATRAQRALSEAMAVVALGGGEYDVVTEDGERAVYTVDLPAGRCTCPDHRMRGARCKHLRRVAIDVTAGRVPAPGERAATCADCSARFHADAADPDPVYCSACRLRPGETVLDRATDDLLVVVRTTDRRAHETPVPGTGYTVASYPGNERYERTDRVVEVVYPLAGDADPESVAAKPPHVYSFPRGRLRRP